MRSAANIELIEFFSGAQSVCAGAHKGHHAPTYGKYCGLRIVSSLIASFTAPQFENKFTKNWFAIEASAVRPWHGIC